MRRGWYPGVLLLVLKDDAKAETSFQLPKHLAELMTPGSLQHTGSPVGTQRVSAQKDTFKIGEGLSA